MGKYSLSLVTLGLMMAACGPADMNKEEVSKILFGSNTGVLGGYDFGDSWEDIKKNHDEVFEVRDDPDIKQLRRKVSDNAGSNGYFLGFRLDDGGKVKTLHASVNGSDQNAVTVRILLDEVIAHFDKTVGEGGCTKPPGGQGNSSNCHWSSVPDKPQVRVMYLEMTDPIRGSITIDVEPPKASP